MVQPGIPHIKIWHDVQSILKFPNVTKRVRPHLEKYFLSDQIEFYNKPVPLETICILNINHEIGFKFIKLSGVEKFNAIRSNTFRIRILDSVGKSESHFHTVALLANSIDVYKIYRPAIPLNIKELAEHVEQKIIFGNAKKV